jgi:hypothetical protein
VSPAGGERQHRRGLGVGEGLVGGQVAAGHRGGQPVSAGQQDGEVGRGGDRPTGGRLVGGVGSGGAGVPVGQPVPVPLIDLVLAAGPGAAVDGQAPRVRAGGGMDIDASRNDAQLDEHPGGHHRGGRRVEAGPEGDQTVLGNLAQVPFESRRSAWTVRTCFLRGDRGRKSVIAQFVAQPCGSLPSGRRDRFGVRRQKYRHARAWLLGGAADLMSAMDRMGLSQSRNFVEVPACLTWTRGQRSLHSPRTRRRARAGEVAAVDWRACPH